MWTLPSRAAEALESGGVDPADVAHPLAVAGRALELDETLQELDRVHHRRKAYRARRGAAAATGARGGLLDDARLAGGDVRGDLLEDPGQRCLVRQVVEVLGAGARDLL